MTHAYEKQLARLLAKPPLRRNDGHTPYTGKVWNFLVDVCAPEDGETAAGLMLWAPLAVAAAICTVAGVWEIFGTVAWATIGMWVGTAYALWLVITGVGHVVWRRQRALVWIDDKYTILAWHKIGVEYPQWAPNLARWLQAPRTTIENKRLNVAWEAWLAHHTQTQNDVDRSKWLQNIWDSANEEGPLAQAISAAAIEDILPPAQSLPAAPARTRL